MSFKPRWYQTESVDAFTNYYFKDGGQEDSLICLPTGSGKTFTQVGIISETIKRTAGRVRILNLTHVKELVEQNHASIASVMPDLDLGIYSASVGRKQTNKLVTVAGIMSIKNSVEAFSGVGLILIDECHTVSDKDSSTYRVVIDALRVMNPKVKVVGLTATPYRLGLGMITDGGLFTKIIYDVTDFDGINRLIDEGFLSDLVAPKPNMTVDTREIKMKGGEFDAKAANDAINLDSITDAALDEVEIKAHDRPSWMFFAQSIEHAASISTKLNERGHSAVVVHSKINKGEREECIANFKAGMVRALVNVGTLTTGFDFPRLDCLVILRMTQSTSLWVQILGRGMRVHANKRDCLVLDFAGNTARLGAVNEPVLPRKKGEKGEGGTAPVKLCPECNLYLHASAKICKGCGFTFDAKTNLLARASVDALVTRKKEIWLEVDGVMYTKQKSRGNGKEMLVANYSCGSRNLKEYICLEHDDHMSRMKAREWFVPRMRFGMEQPTKANEALKLAPYLIPPARVEIRKNGQYWNIERAAWGETHDNHPF